MTARGRLLRSWMFVPGDRQRMIDKALSLHVDAIMMDIEDGVAPSAKQPAREQIGASLDQVAQQLKSRPDHRTPARFVRVNAVGSERFIDANVAWGDEAAIRRRIGEHWDAGADHVCVQSISPDGSRKPDHKVLELLAPARG